MKESPAASSRRGDRSVAPPPVSRFLVWGFERYLTRGFDPRGGFVPRHFHAVRLANWSKGAFPDGRPLVFFLNHPSWWDPIMAFLLARAIVPGRHPYAPIEQKALDRYPLLDRGGLFGVDDTPRGAKRFLDRAEMILKSPTASLWLTPQGEFRDAASRPIRFRAGLGHLAVRTRAIFVPVAVEYRFWNERLPEALLATGDPIDAAGADLSAPDWTSRFEAALAATLDRLQQDAATRDPRRFETLLAGDAGVGFFYDIGRRLRSLLTGVRYRAEHG